MDRYVLIGAGGTGSAFIAPGLAYIHNWQLNQKRSWEFFIVDGDNFEYKNLERQLFDPGFVGTNKADALAAMYDRYPVTSIPKFIGRDDMADLIQEDTIVFIGVDNYSLRALIEEHVHTLPNAVVINAGNEKHDGSIQLWVRENNKNVTPRLSFCHPEITYKDADDRSAMTCAQAALIPGGEQLIIANFAAAQGMLHALWRFHTGDWKNGWTETQFDLAKNEYLFMDFRERKGWEKPLTIKMKPIRAKKAILAPVEASTEAAAI